jgi:nuclear pore complex protein Nup54
LLFRFQNTVGQAPQSAIVHTANIYSAVSMPLLFGDERDAVIAKWNQLQAFWGTGRGYFNQQGQYVDFMPDNPFSFFKVWCCTC